MKGATIPTPSERFGPFAGRRVFCRNLASPRFESPKHPMRMTRAQQAQLVFGRASTPNITGKAPRTYQEKNQTVASGEAVAMNSRTSNEHKRCHHFMQEEHSDLDSQQHHAPEPPSSETSPIGRRDNSPRGSVRGVVLARYINEF